MAELGFHAVSFSYGAKPLLDNVDLQIKAGERIGLIGRNGTGKSTLLKLLLGQIEPEKGRISTRIGLRVAGLEQEVPGAITGTVQELLQAALPEDQDADDWQSERSIAKVVGELHVDPDAVFADLSAGNKRRALLARALISDPDLLILDEPTNHLDLEAICGLEELLMKRKGALLFVTHDRKLMRKISTRIIDLDRGSLESYECNFETYLVRKTEVLEAQEKHAMQFDKKLAQEEAWLRRGVKARRTRNMGRVRSLLDLRAQRSERREVGGKTRALVQDAVRTGRNVIRATGLGQDFGKGPLFEGLDFDIQRGERIGLMGANGCGKTTLLRILLGDLTPGQGTIEFGTNLEIARFDQLHGELDEKLTLAQNICGDADTVMVNGHPRHINGYLQDFLFDNEQVRGPIYNLSGGERNRLALAKVLSRPSNVLVLDEPTNDLDLETLEVLETLLAEYAGTLIIVSHDREFLNNTVTSMVLFEGPDKRGVGVVREYVGGYDEALSQQEVLVGKVVEQAKAQLPKGARVRTKKAKKLTFDEAKELKGLPARIEKLETKVAVFQDAMADPEFYLKARNVIAREQVAFAKLEGELKVAMDKWESLEAIKSGE
ncbi:MAG: ATP-binding cassette subfamily F protein uup [Planctomycetota bacterium]|jgi:ATP-binding cassette subfamily F protein uup